MEGLTDLRGLTKLSCLQLQGNKIRNTMQLDVLADLPVLRNLYLQSASQDEQNPLCSQENYRDEVFLTLKDLHRLDGLVKSMKTIPNAKELEKPKDLNSEQDEGIYWFTKDYKADPARVPEEGMDQKAELRAAEMDLSKKMFACKSTLDSLDKLLHS